MNHEERLNFYLGKQNNSDLIDNNKGSSNNNNENKKTIKDLTNNPIYDTPLKQLLLKTNHSHESFYYLKGDVETSLHPQTLCKNRCAGNTDSVVLRCLEFDRHWQHYYRRPADISFSAKKNKAFWRGTTTGQETRPGNRFTLVKKWFETCDLIHVGFSFICQNKKKYQKYVKGSCDLSHFLQFKYILSVEGNDKDSGLNWKLNSNSLVLMPRPRVTSWLMETTLVPDYHYVVIKDDFSDLAQKVRWCNNHPQKCKDMIRNANTFMQQFADSAAEEQLEINVIDKYFENMHSSGKKESA
jgi:hypothetical protein